MENEKMTFEKKQMDVIINMAEGNIGAVNVLIELLNSPGGFMDILFCDALNIRGTKLYMLHNDCCGRDNEKFKITLSMFRNGVFSKDDIQNNLNLVRAIPFIDDDIVMENISNCSEKFDSTNENWCEFCKKNKISFDERLNKALKNQNLRYKL